MDMDFDTFLIGLYLMVDEWLQREGHRYLRPQGGAPPRLSDAEMLTLLLAHPLSQAQWRERRWLRYLRRNYQAWFPALTSQSAYNRRARNLWGVLNALRIQLTREISAQLPPEGVTDGTPIHVRHWRRYGPRHLALPEADLGYCAAKREYYYGYYGYKLLALVSISGIIIEWGLLSASGDEREGFEEMMCEDEGWLVWGDKGFLDQERQRRLEEEQSIVLIAPTRCNQHQQLHPAPQEQLAATRPIVETTFAQAKGFVDLEDRHAYTWRGLVVRIVAKLTALAVIAWANMRRGLSPLSFVHFAW